MPQVSVGKFAEAVNVPVEKLCQQLVEAGLAGKSAEDTISTEEKGLLLRFLRSQHGDEESGEGGKVTLKRKVISELKVHVASGAAAGRAKVRTKTVNVESRKLRTYVKRSQLNEDLKRKREEEGRQREAEQAAMKAAREALVQRVDSGAEPAGQAAEAKQAAEQAVQQPAAQPTEQATGVEATASDAAPESMATEAAQPARQQATEADALQSEPEAKARAEEKPPVAKSAKPPAKPKEKEQLADRTTGKPPEPLHVPDDKTRRRRRKGPRAKRVVPKVVPEHRFIAPTAPVVRDVELPENISVGELAQRMSVKASEVIKAMMDFGSMVTINQLVDQDTAAILVEQMGHRAVRLKENALEDEVAQASQEQGEKLPRAPVVTVMGHVDHGKTSLLDYIRSAKVASGEAGGITQHIGAYRVNTPGGDITFLDTPGHEAFTAMRARGAKLTDIVIIVIAADDGVMPQTLEAIKHAKTARAPIIIAINKIDREDADVDQVRQELSKHEVVPEDWGGDTQFVPISAKTGEGVEKLLEAIILQTEILELKAVATGPASGVVLESRLDKGRGPVASILVKSGSLKKGDVVLSGQEFGRVRAMADDTGAAVNKAGPAVPVEVLGLSGTPAVGDDMIVVADERKAKEVASLRQGKQRESHIAKQQSSKLEDVLSQIGKDKGLVDLNLLVKADVQGSAEALVNALGQLGNDQVGVRVIHSGAGGITESDINLALAAQGIVIGFNVRADALARKQAEAEGLDVRYYSVIYDVLDDVRSMVSGLTAPEIREQIIGQAEVREVFRSPQFGDIAGCIVTSGTVKLRSPIRVLRDNVVIYEGELESLRRFKDNVKEVISGVECGIGVKNYNNVQVGDQIEAFQRVEVERS